MTTQEQAPGPAALEGWHNYGTYVTLLVQLKVEGTPAVKLMGVDELGEVVRAVGSVPEVWSIGNDGLFHKGQHRLADGTIAFHFPDASENDFAIDAPPETVPA
jgi:hypothetical protein